LFANIRRLVYRLVVGTATVAVLPLRARDGRVALFYAGAYAGDLGGPLVKVRNLAARFPEHRLGFSLVYVLSNAIYLPQFVLNAVRRAGVPVVLNQNGVFYPSWYPAGWKHENERMAAVHASAAHVLYQSEFCRRSAERFLGRRSGPSEILYNAVDTQRFCPNVPEPQRRPFTFLMSGKIVRSTRYRLASAIEAIASARKGGLDVRLVIAGYVDRAVGADARALAAQRGVSDWIKMTGSYVHADAPAVYRLADAYLMTKHNDPCPNVVLEALACGLPVVYSASGGVPELVGQEAGVGLAVPETFDDTPVPDPTVAAEGMARVIANRERMARAARARAVERFCVSVWLDRHEILFKELLATRSMP
jgi:glycosyltransferase involved in cell wall biosynthesis